MTPASLMTRKRSSMGHRRINSNPFDFQAVFAQKRLALRTGKDARRRADGADATGPQGAGDAQAVFGGHAVQEAVDVARVEGVAAAARVDVVHREDAGAE